MDYAACAANELRRTQFPNNHALTSLLEVIAQLTDTVITSQLWLTVNLNLHAWETYLMALDLKEEKLCRNLLFHTSTLEDHPSDLDSSDISQRTLDTPSMSPVINKPSSSGRKQVKSSPLHHVLDHGFSKTQTALSSHQDFHQRRIQEEWAWSFQRQEGIDQLTSSRTSSLAIWLGDVSQNP